MCHFLGVAVHMEMPGAPLDPLWVSTGVLRDLILGFFTVSDFISYQRGVYFLIVQVLISVSPKALFVPSPLNFRCPDFSPPVVFVCFGGLQDINYNL